MAPPRKLDLPFRDCKHCGKNFRALMWSRKDSEPYIQQYCSGTCRNFARGEAKGYLDRHGYKVMPREKDEPQVYEHRAVMAKKIGRALTKFETVHHKNGDRADNSLSNLELWTTRHGRGQRASDLPFIPSTSASHLASGALSLGG